MFKKIITMLLIGLFAIVPVLGGARVVKAEDVEYVKVQVVWDSPETEQQYIEEHGDSWNNYNPYIFMFPDSYDSDYGVRLTKENDWTGYILNTIRNMDGDLVPMMEEIEPGIPKTRLRIENYNDYSVGWNGHVYYCEKVEGNTKDGFIFHMAKKDIKGMLVVEFEGIKPWFWNENVKEDDIYKTVDGGYKTVATLYNDNGSTDVEISANTSNRAAASTFAYVGDGKWVDEKAELQMIKHNYYNDVVIMIENDLDFINSSDELKIKIPDCEVIEFNKNYDANADYDENLKVMKATVKWTPKIIGKKLFGDKKIKNEQFTFLLKENDKIISETRCDEFGNFAFDVPKYDGDGGDSIHIYTIEEKNDNQMGIDYDSHKETVEVLTRPLPMSGDYTYSFEYDDDGAVFENKYNPVGSIVLTGKKTLTGRDIKNREFTFELKENDEVIGQATNTGEDITFPAINYTSEDIGTHTYTISEKKETLGGVEYDTHTETVTVEVSDNGDGTLKTDIKTDDDGITFNNKYSASGSAKIVGKKNLEGKDMDTFSFILKEGDKVIDETTNNAKGEFSFKEIPYTSAGTHTYTIIEKNDNKPGVAYDTHTETVTVDVTDNGDGTLNTDIKTDNDGVTFNNKYSTSGKAVISGKKVLDGKSMDNFTFVLKEGNEMIDEAVNDANGNFSFKELNYTDAGTHTYTITEKNDSKGGIEYDTHTETVVVNTTDNGDGTLKVDVKTDNDGITFNNKYSSSGQVNFIGQKKFNKEMKEFSFELKENGKTIQTVKNDNDGKITFDTISYSLEDVGEHIYTISEVNDNKPGIAYDTHIETVKVNVADNGDGTLTATPVYDTDGVVFENTYSATGKISILGKKIFNNKAMEDFSFVLKEGETEIATVKNSDTGEFIFPEIEYDLKDVGKHTYTITETNDNKPGVTYDEHVETVTVDVVDNGDGTLETVLDEDGVVFTNTYNAEGTFAISGTKKLEGRKLTDGEFTFVLTDQDGNIKETTVKADGTFEFEPFNFTINDIGKTFTYKVTEKNNGIENVTYDEHTEEITISVEDNGDGALKITPVYDEDGVVFVNKYTEPETPTEPKTPAEESTPTTEPTTVDTPTENSPTEPIKETESVDTGDINPTIPLTIIGASALALMLTAIGVRKKYNK